VTVTDQGSDGRLSDEEWRSYFQSLSNWGRWGAADQRGTLNLVDSAKVAAAAGLVREGRQVSCGRVVEFGNRVSVYEAEDAPLHFVSSTGARLNADGAGGGTDWVGFQIHGLYMTHLDAPSHQFWNGTMYNGHPADSLSAEAGARAGSVELAENGIVSRGILLDVAELAGVEALEEGYEISSADLDAAAAAHGVKPEAGDVVLVRTGYGSARRRYRERVPQLALATRDPDPTSLPHLPGLSPSSLPWFHAHDIAVVGSDTGTETRPSAHEWIAPFHVVAMCAMGMWVLDNFELEELADVCRELGRWTFMMVIAPIRFKHTTGSPVNPIALF
jgi:kynurenine formamidase